MSIINDSHAIGVDTRNLVLKTRGTLHVKVGDRYYEIDFRNLAGSKEDEEKIKEEYIISIDSEKDIDKLEYPGDNKLIIGLDGSFFITKNNSIIDVTPKVSTATIETNKSELPEIEITNIKSVHVSDRLYGDNSTFDFANGELTVRTLTVEDEIAIPNTTIKNKCCRTYKEVLDDGSERVARKYGEYDFIEIVEIPEFLSVKSGVMIKSTVDIKIPVIISDISLDEFEFKMGGLYIAYEQNGEVIITKLN
jgi:hypothetical protein